ncbi:MAG: DUF4440 domain-containing protein [Chthoniobacterales bacterium]|nr:DUF4440 domain-containing protein [Chthoniobacterales bacterium]
MKKTILPAAIIPRIGLLFVVSLICGRAAVAAPAMTQEELVRRTQELYDAVVPGDRTPWKRYYADDCLFHDEKGRSLDKAKLIEDISPMPKGYSGTIKIAKPQSVITADTAILSYDSIETETIFGQELHARYHGTDTWLLRHGQWQIVASQTMRYYEDPAVGQDDPAKFAAYAGTYQLAQESERRTMISFEKANLFIERTGGKKVQLFPEAGDLFFRKDVEGRILFHFGKDGKVDTLIDRRNNEDVVWKKVA